MTIEVIRKDSGAVVAYMCPGCGAIYQILAKPESAAQLADECCPARVCTKCGKPVGRGVPLCATCSTTLDAAAEAERFKAAEKVQEAAWRGPIYWPCAPFDGDHGGKYWSSVAVLRADIATRSAQRAAEKPPQPGISAPAYVYATKPVPFRLDGASLIDLALDDHDESAAARIDDKARTELQQYLDAWTVARGISSYEEDMAKVVVLG